MPEMTRFGAPEAIFERYIQKWGAEDLLLNKKW